MIVVPMNEMIDLMTLASKSNKEVQNLTESGESGKKQQFREGDIVMVTDGQTEGQVKVVDKVEENHVLIRTMDHLSVSIQSKVRQSVSFRANNFHNMFFSLFF
jgi:transcription elongation factor